MYKCRIKKRHIAWALLVLAMCFIFYTLDPSVCRLFPRCPFLSLTGWECPGCGSQRALHSLLHLHIIDALHYNVLLVLSIPYIALLLSAEAYRTRFSKFYLHVHKPVYVWCYLAAVILWGVVRNLVPGL